MARKDFSFLCSMYCVSVVRCGHLAWLRSFLLDHFALADVGHLSHIFHFHVVQVVRLINSTPIHSQPFITGPLIGVLSWKQSSVDSSYRAV